MIALLHDGRIVASGTASELKRLVPGGLVEVTFQDERQLKRAFSLLQERYNVTEGNRDLTLTVAAGASTTQLADLFIQLRDARIEPSDFSHKVPTLDDVFFKLTGGKKYVDYITPGIIVLTVISGIAYAAFRLNTDIQKGIINRFRTMPVAPSSILGGQAASSTLSNLFSSLLVLIVAFIIGFRSDAGTVEWLLFAGLLALLTLALTWLAIFFGLLARSAEGAGSFSYVLMLFIFISPSFVPTDSMTPLLRGFAEHQPLTPIVETMRSLLTNGTPGDRARIALAWITGILVVFYLASL